MPSRHRTARLGLASSVLALVASGLVAGPTLAAPGYASAPEGWPAGGWSACSSADDQYCVAAATLTPVGGEATPLTELGLSATVNTLGGYVTSFNWSVDGLDAEGVPAAVRNGDVRLVVRVGSFAPRYTMALAKDLRIARDTDGLGQTTMTLTGRPTHIDWTTGDLFGTCLAFGSCGDADTMADPVGSGFRFSGNTQDLEAWGEEWVQRLDGVYLATDAQARPNIVMFGTYPEPYWSLSMLGNPHLDVDGNPVRGSFNAWLPPSYFTTVGTDAEAAAAVGFDVVSSEGGDAVSLPATVEVRDGGVGIDVPDLGYSTHAVKVFSRQSQAAAPGATTPGRPQQVGVVPAVDGLPVHWSAPDSDGGPAVTSYTARAFTAANGGTVAGHCSTTGVPCAIPGLSHGTTYYVSVSASNDLGEGPGSAPRLSASPVELPTAPQDVALTRGNGRLTATWSAPVSAGGSPLTGYTARAFRTASGGTAAGSCTTSTLLTCAIMGLGNGTPYFVDVTAGNDDGSGPASDPRLGGTPRTVPTTPRLVHATSSGSRLHVGWAAPAATGGAAVTGYRAAAYLTALGGSPAAQCSAAAAARSCTTAALRVGQPYFVAVTAANAAGTSAPSSRVRVLVRR